MESTRREVIAMSENMRKSNGVKVLLCAGLIISLLDIGIRGSVLYFFCGARHRQAWTSQCHDGDFWRIWSHSFRNISEGWRLIGAYRLNVNFILACRLGQRFQELGLRSAGLQRRAQCLPGLCFALSVRWPSKQDEARMLSWRASSCGPELRAKSGNYRSIAPNPKIHFPSLHMWTLCCFVQRPHMWFCVLK